MEHYKLSQKYSDIAERTHARAQGLSDPSSPSRRGGAVQYSSAQTRFSLHYLIPLLPCSKKKKKRQTFACCTFFFFSRGERADWFRGFRVFISEYFMMFLDWV